MQHIGIDTEKFALGDEQLRQKIVLNASACATLPARGWIPCCGFRPGLWFASGVAAAQIGAGGETESLQQLAKSLGIEDRVIWMGQPHDKVN
ncbi:MAG: hypothetical protein U1F63_01760 [Chitinivorax sp.]